MSWWGTTEDSTRNLTVSEEFEEAERKGREKAGREMSEAAINSLAQSMEKMAKEAATERKENAKQMALLAEAIKTSTQGQGVGQEVPNPRPRIPSADYAPGGSSVKKIDRAALPVISQSTNLYDVEKWAAAVKREARACQIALDSPNHSRHSIIALIPQDVIDKMRGTLNLEDMDAIKEKTWEQILEAVIEHVRVSTPNLVKELAMLNRKQAVGESVTEYYTSVKQHVQATSIADDTKNAGDEVTRMLVMAVLRDEWMRKELMKQPGADKMDSREQLQFFERMERAEKGTTEKPVVSNQVESEPVQQGETNHVSSYKRGGGKSNQGQSQRGGHGAAQRGRGGGAQGESRSCFVCGKVGHLKKDCKQKKREAENNLVVVSSESRGHNGMADRQHLKAEVNVAEITEDREGLVSPLRYARVSVKFWSNTGKPMRKSLDCLADTGSQVNLIPREMVRQLELERSMDVAKRHSGVVIKGISKAELEASGMVYIDLQWGRKKVKAKAVISDNETPLLGFQTCMSLGLFSEGKGQWKKAPAKIKCMPVAAATDSKQTEGTQKPAWRSVFSVNHVRVEKEDVRSLLDKEYKDVMDDKSKKLTTMKCQPMKIKLRKNAQPRSVAGPRPIPYADRHGVKACIDEMKRRGVIRQLSDEISEWTSQLHYLRKSDGTLRIVNDLRALNDAIERPVHPSNTPKEALSMVSEDAKFFTVLDLASGYWQVELDEESQLLTSFVTPWGRFAYTRATMGLAPAGDVFCHRTDMIFSNCQNLSKVVDDVLIWGATREECMRHTRAALDLCREYRIKLNRKKAVVAEEEVCFAGAIVNQYGTKPDPDILRALQEFPMPRNRTDLRAFLGLSEQLSAYTREKAGALQPLRILLKKEQEWFWDESMTKAFERTRVAMTSVDKLARYNSKLPAVLETDASCLNGMGFALFQVEEDGRKLLVEAGSRCLTPAESRYAVCEIEMAAAVWAMKKCKLYLQGRRFELHTDHQPLVGYMQKALAAQANKRLTNMASKIAHFTFDVKWIQGKDNQIADALSRSPVGHPDPDEEELGSEDGIALAAAVLSTEREALPARFYTLLKERSAADPRCQALRARVQGDLPWRRADDLFDQKDMVSVGSDNSTVLLDLKPVIPEAMKEEMLQVAHRGHIGREAMTTKIRQAFHWRQLSKDVDNYVARCHGCAQLQRSKPALEIARSRPPMGAFTEAAADIFEMEGSRTYYIVMVDALSGWFECERMGGGTDGIATAMTFRKWFSTFGAPVKLKTDNGPQFTSGTFKALMDEFSIDHVTSSPYHPASNGLAESGGVKNAKRILKHHPINTAGYYTALQAVRNSEMRTRGETPAQMVMGRSLRTADWPAEVQAGELPQAAERARKRLEDDRADDKPVGEPVFKEGDRVLLQDQGGKSKRWSERGMIVQSESDRSFLVRTDNGPERRRNERFLRHERDGSRERVQNTQESQGLDGMAREKEENSQESQSLNGMVHKPKKGPGRPKGSRLPRGPPTRRSSRTRTAATSYAACLGVHEEKKGKVVEYYYE